jgi:ribulose 1,5-bisphosphate synthetase/thiazole synthase
MIEKTCISAITLTPCCGKINNFFDRGYTYGFEGKYMKTDVLIVGVRPTGPAPAGQLVRYGVDFVIFDKKSRPAK